MRMRETREMKEGEQKKRATERERELRKGDGLGGDWTLVLHLNLSL